MEISPEILNAYVDGELTSAEAASVARAAADRPAIAARIAILCEMKAAVSDNIPGRKLKLLDQGSLPLGRIVLAAVASIAIMAVMTTLYLNVWMEPAGTKWARLLQFHHTAWSFPNRDAGVNIVPVAPGEKVEKKDFVIIHAMPVKALIINPATGIKTSDKEMEVRGHAWAGDRKVDEVAVSIDFGATWQKAKLSNPVNDYAWQHFTAVVEFPQAGYYEIWAKATDSEGVSQPHAIAWNPKGYLNNSMHRVAVTAG